MEAVAIYIVYLDNFASKYSLFYVLMFSMGHLSKMHIAVQKCPLTCKHKYNRQTNIFWFSFPIVDSKQIWQRVLLSWLSHVHL